MRHQRWPLLFLLLNASAAFGEPGKAACPVLSTDDRLRVARWMERRFKISAPSRVEITEASIANAACFQKLQLRSSGPSRSVPSTVFLSPDRRFLTFELLDTRTDPLLEEKEKRRKLEAGLIAPKAPALGPANARATITVFSDFQCPYCSRLAYMLRNEVLPFERDNVRLVFRHFPLQNHAWARAAAEETACAGEQNVDYFWHFHDFIFERQRELTKENLHQKLVEESKRLPGLDVRAFNRCLAEHKTAATIDNDLSVGTGIGVEGTPSVFVNAQQIQSVVNPEQVRSLIREITKASVKQTASSR